MFLLHGIGSESAVAGVYLSRVGIFVPLCREEARPESLCICS